MMVQQNGLLCCLLLICLLTPASPLQAAETPQGDSIKELISQLQEQNRRISKDLHRIRRELAALRADLDKPGLNDIFGGIGYIFGLFGVAAYVSSRRKKE